MKPRLLLAAMLAVTLAQAARADLFTKAGGELMEQLVKKFGREVAEEGAERLAGRIASAAARHGDDVLSAVRRIGPKALSLADDAGKNAPRAMRFLTKHGDDAAHLLGNRQGMMLFTRFGDDAAEVMIKHQGIAAPMLEKLGGDAVQALGAVGTRNGRRLAMLADDGASRLPELMKVVAKNGDPAMEFIWKHKATLAGGAALTAFLANPEPFLAGTNDLTNTVAEHVVTPVAQHVVKPAVQATATVAHTAIWMIGLTLLGITGTVAALLYWLQKTGLLEKVAGGAGPIALGVIKRRLGL